ncbi:MAG: SulP family inorganic anion transporter [Methylacidiphilales bacterium]|nr:SulP family inorganic anion transporter [Candidatus Methylacidiphilales bacterium]
MLTSLSGYRRAWLRTDVSAGLAIAAVGLPSAIAYPAIAGLPPETGIYASIAPLVAYAVFGPSRRLIVGPDAATMTILAGVMAAVLGSIPAEGTDRVAVAALLALVVGGLCLVARLLQLGVLANFLSQPILTGFFAGISLSILVGQITRVTGVQIEADGLIGPLVELVRKIGMVHWPSLLLAAAMFVLLQVARVARSPIPGAVLVVVISVTLSALFDFEAQGIAVVGTVPEGLPTLALPGLAGVPIDKLLLGAAAIFLVSFSSGAITARSFGALTKEPVDANRELTGFGAANIAAGLFGAFPVSASDSRTAVNVTVGGRTQLAGLVSAAALIAVLLLLRPALRVMPISALGAILAATALQLMDFAGLRRIWTISRVEFAFALIALVGPISLGVLNGVVIAISATLIYLLHKIMYPQDAVLGRIPGRDGFYKMHRFPEAQPVPGLMLGLIQGSILFFNADYVRARIRAIIEEVPKETRWFVLDASAIVQIDSTGAMMLEELAGELADRGIRFGLAEVHAAPRALLERAGVADHIGASMIFPDLDDALRAFRASHREDDPAFGQPS